jgi:hypothetical protein
MPEVRHRGLTGTHPRCRQTNVKTPAELYTIGKLGLKYITWVSQTPILSADDPM